MKRSIVFAVAALAAATGVFPAAAANAPAGCSAADFGAVVDQTAAALRDLNVNGAQRFQAKLASRQGKAGLSPDEIEKRVASIQDEKVAEFNREIETLVGQMDQLSQTPNNQVTCSKLEDLKRIRDRLLTVMGQKSGYLLARADVLLDKPDAARPAKPQASPATATEDKPQPAGQPWKTSEVKPETAPQAAVKPVAQPKPEPARTDAIPALPERRPAGQRAAASWQVQDKRPADQAAALQQGPAGAAGMPPAGDPNAYPTPVGPSGDAFSMSEIRDAGRGVFGTITAEFAGAIEYAFHNFGQPNAFIDGTEGGGAFLAGLRYGKGVLHRKGAPDTPIYWQGPSAGLDLGAEGSRALFLVYNAPDADAIYGRFTGIGGSAYVAGGLGINVLGKGKMVMVPIRSGLGLRLGANLAYLKFTDRQTWNPF